MNYEELAKPFSEKDIEWRIARSGEKNGKIWAKCLAYVTNRAIMDRLDQVCGQDGWQNEFVECEGGFLCTIKIWNGERWVSKTDGADRTQIESFKGGLSGAMKRAAVQWGIGRYLYSLPEGWADISPAGIYSGRTKEGNFFNWFPPELPKWALPKGELPTKWHKPQKKEVQPEEKSPRQVAIDRIGGLVENWGEESKAELRQRIPDLDLQGLHDLIADIEQGIIGSGGDF